MKWREFSYFINGLDHKTPLGRIISIRAEDNRDVLKDFTPEQRRIRAEWKTRRAKAMSKEKTADGIRAMQRAFAGLITGEANAENDEKD